MTDDRMPERAEPPREQAIEAAAPTDAAAFAKLFDVHVPRIYGFVARRVEDRQTAEEVTSIVFRRAADVLRAGGAGGASIGGFLHLVAASALASHERRRREEIPTGARASDVRHAGDADSSVDELAARAFAAAVDRDALRRSLQRLSEHQLRVVLLKYLDGLDPEEMCTVLSCSRQELAIELHRALRALRGIGGREASGAA